MDLKKLINRIKSIPIDLRKLGALLPPRCGIIQYKDLPKSRSQLFSKHDAYVVRIPNKQSKIGHFVVILAKRNHTEFFSSIGGSIKSEFKRLGQDPNAMLNLLGQHHIYNSKKLQQDTYTVEDCACWCLARCCLKNLRLREFQSLFAKSIHLQSSDDIVSLMCLLSLAAK